MDKLKTRVLFIALIILALVSVSAVAAADVDDVVSVEQDDIDLSEETVSDVEDTQEPILADDPSDDVNEDGSSNVTVFIEVKNATGDVITRNISGVATPDKDWVLSKSTLYNRAGQNVETTSEYSYVCTGILDEDGNNVTSNRNFAATGRNYTVTYKATYTEALNSFITVFVEIRNKTGDVTLGNITGVVYDGKSSWTLSKSTLYSTFGKNVFTESEYSYLFAGSILDEDGNNVTKNKYFPNTGSNYSVSTYKVLYTESHNSRITTVYEVMTSNGPINNTGPTNVLTYNSKSWSIGKNTFDNQIANYKSCDYEGYHYTFDHWVDKDGNTVTPPYKVYWTEEDYNATFKAVYNKEKIGSLRVNYIDTISHGGGGMNYTEHATDYKHTFKEPADIPSGALFLYWENENGTKYSPGDNLTIKYAEFKGIDKVVNVYAVYDIKTSIELEEITGYVGDTADITAIITEDLTNKAVPGGTATLTVDYANKLSNGLLGASTYTDTVEVDADGKAVFKDVKLENPGTYKYTVTYSRYNYNHHEEGINDYLPSEADSKLNILPLNTTTTSEDVSGTVGDKKDITTDIVDQNGDPVQNGTAVLKVNGKEYTAEVKDGKAVFKDVELTENTTATIEYLGNDYYNPSNTTIEITVTAPEEPAEETSDDPEEPAEEPEEEPSTPVAEKAIPIIPATGNPIALVILALLTLVSTVSLGNKK